MTPTPDDALLFRGRDQYFWHEAGQRAERLGQFDLAARFYHEASVVASPEAREVLEEKARDALARTR